MGKMILHTGPAGPYYFFRDRIREHLLQNDAGFLCLLPVNRAVRYFKKELVEDLAPRTIADPHIFTFNGLFRFLYQKIPQRKVVAGKMIRLTLLQHLFRKEQTGLEYFRSGRGRLIVRIDQMMAEMLEFGLYNLPGLEPPESCRIKFNDFQQIIRIVLEKYGDVLIDEYALPDTVISTLDETFVQKILGSGLNIYVHGYGIYTPQMIRLLERMKAWCNIEVKLDYAPGNPQLFRHTRDAYEMLKRLADRERVFNGGDPAWLKLFSPGAAPVPSRSGGTKFCLLSGRNPQDEITRIAAMIRQWYGEQIPLHQIGVTFPDLEAYAPLIRRIFRRFKIPYNLSTGFALAESPLIQSYLKVIEVVLSGYQCAEFHKLLIAPFCQLHKGIDARLFLRIITKRRIRYLRGNWQQKFLSVADDPQAGFKISPEDLQDQTAKIDRMLQIMKRLETAATVDQLSQTYLGTLQDMGMLNWYKPDEPWLSREQQEKEFRAFNRFIKLIEQLRWIMSYLYQERMVTGEDLYRYLRPLVQESTYNLKEWSGYGVQIMPRLEIQSLGCKTLIVGGLIEGDFPRRYTRDIFFNDLERQQLGLNATEDLVDQDRFLFYQLMMSAAEKIVLCHPQFDGDTALLPSTFIESLAALYPLEELNSPDADSLITGENFLETLSGKLNTGVSESDLTDLAAWSGLNGTEHAAFWIDSIDHHLKKQLRQGISRYEGDLSGSPAIRSILHGQYSGRVFSVTALESYAFCPMQYFLQRILGLEEEEPAEEFISALEKGALIHSILFRFYDRLREKNAADHPWDFRDLLMEIADQELDRLPYEGLIWMIERESLLGAGGRPGLLDRFLEVEQAFLPATGYTPRFFELAFGPAGRRQACDPASLPAPLKLIRMNTELNLTGKIDRIDTDPAGRALIVDYKLSGDKKGRRLDDMISGLSLQLPVYTLAAARILERIDPVAAAYYQVKDARNCGRQFAFAKGEADHHLTLNPKIELSGGGEPADARVSFDGLLELAEGHLFRHAERLTSGKFTHTLLPDDERCAKYCPYSRICRKDVGKLRQSASEGGSR